MGLFVFLSLVTASAADLLVGPAQSYTTIDDAMGAANAGDRLLVDPGTYVEPEMAINQAITIEATGGLGTVLIELSGGPGLFELRNNGDLSLIGLEVDGLGQGRLISMRNGILLIDTCDVHGVRAPVGQRGAVIDADSSAVLILQSSLRGAVIADNGGLIYLNRTAIDVRDSVLEGGTTPSDGGAIYAQTLSPVVIESTTLSGNVADVGSAVYANGTDLIVRSATVTGNSAQTSTFHCQSSAQCNIENALFDGNTASTGAIVTADNATTTLLNASVFCGTTSGGPAVDLIDTTATLTANIFLGNGLDDTLVHIDALTTADVVGNHFVGTTSTGAGAVLRVSGTATFVNNLVAYNVGVGPAVVAQNGSLTEAFNLYFDNLDTHADVVLAATSLVDVDPVITMPAPGYCDTTGLVPGYDSPAINAGDPTILDDDGTASDIGAFGNLVGNPLTDGDDDDGDGFGGLSDCNDLDPTIHPNATEIPCNGVDEDCNPATSDQPDADADGIGACDGDCDDADPTVFPGAVEVQCNGVDEDCDLATADQPDLDGDGVSSCVGDCDDLDVTIYPGAAEVICDDIDNDCDLLTVDQPDEDGDGVSICDDDCNDQDPNRTVLEWVFKDSDRDGFGVGNSTLLCGIPVDGATVDGDCDDDDPSVYPGAEEVLYDGIDQDCDGFDLDDVDGDGVIGPDDCDDRDPDRYPGNTDVPEDGIDQDCTGWDPGTVLTGGAGWTCGGCSTTAYPGHGAGFWLVLVWLVGRRRRSPI